MYTGSPQAASSSNAIRWATVNGGSPASADPYQRQESDEDEESCEEGFLDSAADSDANGKLNRSFDRPAGVSHQPFVPLCCQDIEHRFIIEHSSAGTGASVYRSLSRPI